MTLLSGGQNMRQLATLSLLVIAISLSACSRIYGPVKELNAYLDAKDALLTEWAKALDAHPDEQGVDACRKAFDARKADIAAKYKAFDEAPHGMNSDYLTRYFADVESDGKVLNAMESKLISGDQAAGDKFKALRKELEALKGK